MTPRQSLDVALRLLTDPAPSMRRCWPRACAALTRLALEQGLRLYWIRVAPSLVDRPMRHQLLALSTFAGVEVGSTARSAWYGLSRAVHHHTYELAPTAAELQGWHRDVSVLLDYLAQSGSEIIAGKAWKP